MLTPFISSVLFLAGDYYFLLSALFWFWFLVFRFLVGRFGFGLPDVPRKRAVEEVALAPRVFLSHAAPAGKRRDPT
jgi:hypothetical protein